ncbi:ATPase domain-containing protein [Anaerobacillus isosaccharinicus]|uniref:Circadian clock protein KaiC n=1 Tax=Anaerobacillus isosaccharinicus TaxID=1532552 RepID=A0A1S2LVG8_9BACI|nr:ATPase domain-containing protein [Anaerobacillus isosaccharinicus]MBA5584966.1 circadian clock protein KaiC [Anaerobacillus isosaccharinicus]QOY36679.1 circadian clock protein KaiC [Anaerobacillus isosaccharinicus]
MNNQSPTGISGLDHILNGGFPTGSSILLDGAPGTGKTILGMQYLVDGVKNYNESGIYITFEEFPEQIYREMSQFGWEIKELEKQNKLRVICMSPKVLIEQMKLPNGIFEQIIKEIDCKRIVIDSLNLFHDGIENTVEKRNTVNILKNTFKKFSLTSIFINERNSIKDEEISFVSYLSDGVIRLALKEHETIYRKRTLEILKMRGCKIQEGEHIYRITDTGIYLIPALSMFEDKYVTDSKSNVATGITSIDNLLLGGIPRGTVFVLDTNSKANYKYFITSIISSRIKAGENVLMLLSNLMSILDVDHLLRLYGLDLKQLIEQRKIIFIEHYERPIPETFKSAVIMVKDLDNQQFKTYMREKIDISNLQNNDEGEKWFVFFDLNTLVSQRGKDFVISYFTEEIALISASGMSMLALSNFKEIGTETASFLERTCSGVFQTWVDGNYQYFQLKKSPQGIMSRPLVVENISSLPFIRLI